MSHRPAELRSIELHRAVARIVAEDSAVLARASAKVDAWLANGGPVSPARAARWRALLDGDREELLAMLVADTPDACDLRQATPCAGVVDARERWRILREVG